MTFCVKIALCLFVAAKHPNQVSKCNAIKNTMVLYGRMVWINQNKIDVMMIYNV